MWCLRKTLNLKWPTGSDPTSHFSHIFIVIYGSSWNLLEFTNYLVSFLLFLTCLWVTSDPSINELNPPCDWLQQGKKESLQFWHLHHAKKVDSKRNETRKSSSVLMPPRAVLTTWCNRKSHLWMPPFQLRCWAWEWGWLLLLLYHPAQQIQPQQRNVICVTAIQTQSYYCMLNSICTTQHGPDLFFAVNFHLLIFSWQIPDSDVLL